MPTRTLAIAAAAAAAPPTQPARSGARRRYVEQALERVAGGRVERLMSPRVPMPPLARSRAAALCETARSLPAFERRLRWRPRQAFEQAVAARAGQAPARAAALASLAQHLMLDGHFDESADAGRERRGVRQPTPARTV